MAGLVGELRLLHCLPRSLPNHCRQEYAVDRAVAPIRPAHILTRAHGCLRGEVRSIGEVEEPYLPAIISFRIPANAI